MEEQRPEVPTNAADATEEVNQRQAEDRAEVEQGVTQGGTVQAQPDERVPEQPLNSTVTSDQPVTEPARLEHPEQPDNPDSEAHQQVRQDIADQGPDSQE